MSNVRPWFRLSSIAKPSQGSSDPPPSQPRQTPRRSVIVRPPAKQPSPPRQQQTPSPTRQQKQPASPPRQQTPPHPSPQERSPYHAPPSRHMSPPTPPKVASPPQPLPRSSYTPPPSPKEVQEALPMRKPNSPPSPVHSTPSTKFEPIPRKVPSPQRVLSPYSPPPSQLHSERETTQKNILTAEKKSQLHESHHQNRNHSQYQNYNHSQNQNYNHTHQGHNTKKFLHQPSSSESENIMGTRVLTISGENKGALMEILRSGTHSTRVLNGAGEKGRRLQSSSSDEGEGKKNTTKNPNNGNDSNLPMKAFMNSNVQMINNSVVYNSAATHNDPGIHLKISPKPGSGNGFHVKDYGSNGGYTN